MKILKYLVILTALSGNVFAQQREWFVFRGPELPFIKLPASYTWPSVDIQVAGSKSENDGNLTPVENYKSFLINTAHYFTIPGNFIICMISDKDGSIWIGTDLNGLAKYDGQKWTQYTVDNSGLPDNTVYSLAIDSDNTLWVGTRGGLARFVGKEWKVYNQENSSLPSNVVYSIAVEKNGVKWIGTSKGLARFNGRTWKIYNTRNSRIRDNNIGALNIDPDGNKWIGTFDGLIKFNGASWQIINSSNSGLPYDDIYSISISEDGYPAAATWGGGLATFNGRRWSFIDTENSSLPDDYVSSTIKDKEGARWVGTLKGLARFDGYNWTVFNKSNTPLPDNEVYSLLEDKSGNIWIGTRNGLAVYRKYGIRILRTGIDDFEASVYDNEVTLSWQTSAAQTYSRFEIERRMDDSDWKKVGAVNEGFTIGDKIKYRYKDRHNGTGRVYYRLKIINEWGGMNYSYETETVIDQPYEFILKTDLINLSQGPVKISFGLRYDAPAVILIRNIYGENVFEWESFNVPAGFHEIEIEAGKLPLGIYTCELRSGNLLSVKRLVVGIN